MLRMEQMQNIFSSFSAARLEVCHPEEHRSQPRGLPEAFQGFFIEKTHADAFYFRFLKILAFMRRICTLSCELRYFCVMKQDSSDESL
ncbi:hypothetical protein NPIL_374101 [Nephila pilipes]|uniref:Uncharacterized protein n=1 Tax=Nephila pilipes TaxID=299642 RepID=A0A8X6TU15_NEPPI|nr:hypothetical protein NPIL_374101 [Nephila pilipes]